MIRASHFAFLQFNLRLRAWIQCPSGVRTRGGAGNKIRYALMGRELQGETKID